MNGPEHYAEAEALLKKATSVPKDLREEQYLLAAAQVHATLAFAAATAAGRVTYMQENFTETHLHDDGWNEVTK